MREIKFRGQRVENKEWVYGCLVNNLWLYNESHSFHPNAVCEIITGKYGGDCWEDIVEDENALVCVIPESVGQFTGLNDKNDKEIYEGDVVNFAVKKKTCPDCAKKERESKLEYRVSKFCPECGKSLTDADFITIAKVVFDNGGFAYEWSNERSYYQSWKTYAAEVYLAWVEVVGNIYENPELLTSAPKAHECDATKV